MEEKAEDASDLDAFWAAPEKGAAVHVGAGVPAAAATACVAPEQILWLQLLPQRSHQHLFPEPDDRSTTVHRQQHHHQHCKKPPAGTYLTRKHERYKTLARCSKNGIVKTGNAHVLHIIK